MSQPEQKYLTNNDVSMRLYNSIVKYKGEFYWAVPPVLDTLEDHTRLNLQKLSTGQIVLKVSANDEDLDVTSPEVGWMDVNGTMIYVARAPYRKQKQGISQENLIYYQATPPGVLPTSTRLSNDHCVTKAFETMLTLDRVDYAEAYAYAARHANTLHWGAALSKHYALISDGKAISLYKRVTQIGTAEKDGVTLLPEHNNSINIMMLSNIGVPIV